MFRNIPGSPLWGELGDPVETADLANVVCEESLLRGTTYAEYHAAVSSVLAQP
ncbi:MULTISPECIES: hypothetical protein [Thermoprotei]|uniref:hypothetical protein n=1 Tax=Thermoprotei TaxID=183924 RepID=UPI00315EA5F4